MDRRQFLKTMVAVAAVAATGTLLPTTEAAAVVAPEINKYKEAIRLFDRAVAVSWDGLECNRRFDELCVFLKQHWTTPRRTPEVLAAARDLIRTKEVDISGIRSIPPSVADEIYPIALFKMGLCSYKLPLDSGRMKMFSWFHKEYGWIVIQSG